MSRPSTGVPPCFFAIAEVRRAAGWREDVYDAVDGKLIDVAYPLAAWPAPADSSPPTPSSSTPNPGTKPTSSGTNTYGVRYADTTRRCTCPGRRNTATTRGPCKHIFAIVIVRGTAD